ncbi:MAG TPA: YebC/PmpR family DNA-binding transcriptional regulator [Dehalococcoidia bacterium]|nr:YebC/PmpR family DNA-binding transcriptional regulator [Dehalococcoidia bacterium]
MGGHSHWSTIKRSKGAADAKRGQIFTRCSREISVAAREGGGDPTMNPRLRLAIEKAKEQNMPNDTIKRAIEKGAGGGEGANLEEIVFEGYGPGGVAILVEVVTDNRNRSVSALRTALSRGGGNLGESGSVAWQFESKGLITIEADGADPDELALAAIDAGADDVQVDGSIIEVHTAPTELAQVRTKLADGGFKIASAELSMIPKNTVPVDQDAARQALRLLDTIEDLDDVQKVYSNADFPEAALMEYAAA